MRDHVRLALSGDLSVSARSAALPLPRSGERVLRRRTPPALPWLALVPALVYAVALLVNFHELITAVYVNSDAALAPVLGQGIGHAAAGSYVSLGNHAWYEEWLFLLATRSLPGYRQLWEIAPLLWSGAGLGLMLWAARAALGAWSATLTGAALLCVGAFGRFCFLAINWHSLSLVHTALMAAVLVWLVPRVGTLATRKLVAIALLLGLVSALPTASDSLFPFWALLPSVAAAAAAATRLAPAARLRLALFSGVTLFVAIAGALALAAVMHSAGVTSRALPVAFAPHRLLHNLELFGESFAFIAGGRLGSPGAGARGVLVWISGALALLALLAVLDQLRRLLVGPARRARMSDAELAYVAFWGCALLATSAVYLLTDAPKDALSGRYLLGAYAATAALLPLAARRHTRARQLLTGAVCAFAAIAAFQLIDRPFVVISSPQVQVRFPGPSTAAALARFAGQERVRHGYGGYWDAEELTWSSDFAVPIRPVRVCRSGTHALCYPQLGMISSWYTPTAGRSLLVVDSPGTSYDGVLAPDPALGRPEAARRIGYITAYVYPYDIAARLARPRCGFSWARPC